MSSWAADTGAEVPLKKLPKLQRSIRFVDKDGFPTIPAIQWWDAFVNRIETQENSQDALLAALAAVNAAVVVVEAAAASASADAATAQSAAAGANSVASLTNSGVTGVTITATDAGANVTVTISAHTRVYGDGTSVAVNAGSVLALAYSTLFYIYYDQASRLGGAVTYLATTSVFTAAQTGNRHLVGKVTTPAAAAPATVGNEVQVPGLGNIP